jgi:hypothetical protein
MSAGSRCIGIVSIPPSTDAKKASPSLNSLDATSVLPVQVSDITTVQAPVGRTQS